MNTSGVRVRRRAQRPWRLASTGAAAFAMVVSGAGCAKAPAEPPPLVWVDGEPDGPLEDDPWVRMVRAGEAAYTYARNTGDFTRPELVDSWDYAQVSSLAGRVRGQVQSKRPRVELGPQPFAPLSVREEDDGRRVYVVGCSDAQQWSPPYDDGNRWPAVIEYLIEMDDDGQGRIIGSSPPLEPVLLDDGTELTPEYCDDVPIPRAVFEPAPDPRVLARLRLKDVAPPPSPTPRVQ